MEIPRGTQRVNRFPGVSFYLATQRFFAAFPGCKFHEIVVISYHESIVVFLDEYNSNRQTFPSILIESPVWVTVNSLADTVASLETRRNPRQVSPRGCLWDRYRDKTQHGKLYCAQ